MCNNTVFCAPSIHKWRESKLAFSSAHILKLKMQVMETADFPSFMVSVIFFNVKFKSVFRCSVLSPSVSKIFKDKFTKKLLFCSFKLECLKILTWFVLTSLTLTKVFLRVFYSRHNSVHITLKINCKRLCTPKM